jgi:hypothetical protein
VRAFVSPTERVFKEEFMNQDQEQKQGANQAEVQKRKRAGNRPISPEQWNDVEDRRCYTSLMERLFVELAPGNVQQEGDLISMAQLRWSSERVNSLIESELNHRVRMPLMQNIGDTRTRLMMAYRSCLGERTFNLLIKQHLDTIKTLNSLSARVEKWSGTSKSPARKPKEN